jgi:phenylalanyl-tRNA synthetase beta chain
VFIDVTGPESRLVGRALNVLFTSLLELTPGAVGERVRVVGIDGEEETPDLGRQRVDLAVGEASRVLGPPVDPDQEPALLERMGHRVSRDGERLAVDVPAWRNDVLHARDLVEDVAIAFGYDNLDLGLVETQTVGEARPVEEAAGLARSVMTGLGHLEVMTLPLVSESSAYSALRLTPDEGRVVLANPISTEQTMLRTSLLQGLLATFALNASHEMPQRIFEVGAVTRLAEDAETGAEERRLVAAGVIGPQVGFAAIRTVAEAFLGEFGLGIDVRPMDSGLFLAGRGAYLLATGPDGPLEVGLMGEVHPEVLENLKLVQPAAVLELDLEITAGLA